MVTKFLTTATFFITAPFCLIAPGLCTESSGTAFFFGTSLWPSQVRRSRAAGECKLLVKCLLESQTNQGRSDSARNASDKNNCLLSSLAMRGRREVLRGLYNREQSSASFLKS